MSRLENREGPAWVEVDTSFKGKVPHNSIKGRNPAACSRTVDRLNFIPSRFLKIKEAWEALYDLKKKLSVT